MSVAVAELHLRCSCGRLHGIARHVGPRSCVRLSCYCQDCQAFARFLQRADELLDRHGGTEVIQTTPAQVELTTGLEHLACMRLSPTGLLRWYASCCRTPIANTGARPKLPFVGVLQACWDPTLDAVARDALLGPRRARINGPGQADADGNLVPIDRLPLGALWHGARVFVGGWLRRAYRPSPFFDPQTGAPRVTPRVLGSPELALLRGSARGG